MALWRKVTGTVLVDGKPEPNVKVYFYEKGTTNPIPVYSDEGSTPADNPQLTDAAGRYAVYVNAEAYPVIRIYLEKDGVDFTEANADLDGIAVPGSGGGGDGGGGASTFLELTDTPSSYSGSGGKVVRVKSTEDGLEFGQVDHGELAGLSDDDHPQYLLADGSRPLSGDLDFQGHLAKVIGKLNFKDATTLTISSGEVTVSQSYHYVDTEDGASTDDLDTINGGTAGDTLYLRAADSSRTVVIKHGTGNIVTPDGNDCSLDSTDKVVALLFDGTNWHLVGAAGGGSASTSVIVPGYYKGLDFQNADDEVQVDDCETAWTASASGVSTSVDTADYKEGSGSQKIEVSSTVSAGNLLAYYDLPSSVDWSKHWGVRFWFKSSIALSNNQVRFAVDDSTGMGSPIQGAAIPALDANTWYEVTLYLDPTATGMNSVASIGLKVQEDLPACTLHIDDIRMVCSTHKVSVQPGAVAVRKVTDDSWDEIKTVDSILTGDIETSGLGGLESGDTLGTDKWYEVYVVFDSSGTPGVLFNEADTSVTWPSGITHYRLIGYVFRDANGNLRPFFQKGDICLWNSKYIEVLNTTSPASMDPTGLGSWSPIDVSSAVPPNARYIRLYVLVKGTGDTTDMSYWTVNFAAHGLDSLGRDIWYGVSRVSLDVTETFYQSIPVPLVPVDDSRMIGYQTIEVDALIIRAVGYELDRRSL